MEETKKQITRRQFCKVVLSGGAGVVLSNYFAPLIRAPFGQCLGVGRKLDLPPPIVNPHSTEICLNSRMSYHGWWSDSATQQMLSNVLWAMGKVPVLIPNRTIYVANGENVFTYDPEAHSLSVHLAGDHRSDSDASFQIGYFGDSVFDAGVAMGIAQLESFALWNGTSDQLASCPRTTDRDYAVDNWQLPEPQTNLRAVTSFGIMDIDGLTSTLVVNSSDGSLTDPVTNGSNKLDEVISGLKYGTGFKTDEVNPNQLSQLLWAGYGCNDHYLPYGPAGLTVASAHYNYYLTRRIYLANSSGVSRYHNRLPPSTDIYTRDHRIESINLNDVRSGLQSAVTGLPVAPSYLILCLDSGESSNYKAILEVGFVAMGALVQSSSDGLQVHFRTSLTSEEQSEIQNITGIPSSDIPIAIVSVGHPEEPGIKTGDREKVPKSYSLSQNYPNPFNAQTQIKFTLPKEEYVRLEIHNEAGQMVEVLANRRMKAGSYITEWDGRGKNGRKVASGIYFYRMEAGSYGSTRKMVFTK